MTALSFVNGRILTPEGPIDAPVTLRLDGDRILGLDRGGGGSGGGETIDLGGGWLAPGLIDVQTNGGGGVLFNDSPTVDAIRAIGDAHLQYGVTGFLPTLVSDRMEVVARGLDAVDATIDAGSTQVLGIHIEGPFISPEKRGIHHPDRIRRLDDAAMALLARPRRGKVMVTLAPERCRPDQIAALTQAGVIVSLGHSNASAHEAQAAFEAGARGVTHLFNAMSPLHHRAPGLVGAALDTDDCWCGLIVDGVHVDPIALRLAYRVKGPSRLMLVSDAMPPSGTGMTEFRLNDRLILVRDGRYIGEDGALAGANLTMAQAVANAVGMMGATPEDAMAMASTSPSAFLGLDRNRGVIAPGRRADLVHFGSDLQFSGVWVGGKRRED